MTITPLRWQAGLRAGLDKVSVIDYNPMGEMQQEKRIKFRLKRLQNEGYHYRSWYELANVIHQLDPYGCFPVLDDGKICGNIAIISDRGLIVSRSGRNSSQESSEEDFVKILDFDPVAWKATYLSVNEEVYPTSDTPLYWAALVEMPNQMALSMKPKVALHGHAFQTEEAAEKLNLPISKKETCLATPDDRQALVELLEKYPYPTHKIFIRKGHGFFILEENLTKLSHLAEEIFSKAKTLKVY